MSTLCIIPARGGSKRIPKKNIKPFRDKPIITYPIQEARASGCFDDIVVSSDDNDTAVVALNAGAGFHKRTAVNSSDIAVLADVLSEVLEVYNDYEYVCCLLPTAVMVESGHIRSAFETLKETTFAEQVMSVAKFGYPIQRALQMGPLGYVNLIQPEHLNSLSNDLKPAYHDAGQFYWMRTEAFLTQRKIILDKTLGYELLESEVQDIDTDEDWLLAEIKYSRRLEAQKAVAR